MEKNIIEAKDFSSRIKADIEQRFPIISSFLLLMIVLKIVFKAPFSNFLFFLVSLMLLTSIPVTFIFDKLQKRAKKAVNFYFGYLLFDLIWLTAIIYFVGGITLITPIFYSFYIINTFWLFPRTQAVFLTGYCGLLLALLTIWQYFEILPHPTIFLPEERNPQNFSYVFATAVAALITFGFLGYISDTFYQLLRIKIRNLKKTKKELNQTKRFLEIEVERKTKELWEEKESLGKIVEERTKELEEKRRVVQARLKELEKFHKIAVVKELKMAEIKEEIARLKELKANQ